jgi:Transglycosylase SLT domain
MAVASGQIPTLIVAAAQRYGVPPNLALEVALKESNLNQGAVSPAGAIGVMQLEPATAAGLGVDPNDTAQNIDGGVRYLAQLLAQFGSTDKALAAYNWGPGNVSRSVSANGDSWLSSAPGETQNYVGSILTSLGMNWQATVTPASVASGATDVLASVAGSVENSVQPVNSSSIFLLLAAALGAYVLFGLVTDDD